MHSKAKSLWAVFAALLMAASLLAVPANAEELTTGSGLAAETVADPYTLEHWAYTFGTDGVPDTAGSLPANSENVGRIWTDKSVFAEDLSYPNQGIELKKSEGSQFLVGLSALSSASSELVQSSTPLDIVLVLDVSGSMDGENGTLTSYSYDPVYTNIDTRSRYYIEVDGEWERLTYSNGGWGSQEGWYYESGNNRIYVTAKTSATDTTAGSYTFHTRTRTTTTKLAAMKSAVNSFIDATAEMNEEITDDSKQHQIALVKFASDENTSVGDDKTRDEYNYSQIVKKLGTSASDLKTAVNALTASGATQANYGLSRAEEALKNARTDSKKIVILFTDGEPTSRRSFEEAVANAAISKAKTLKAAGTTIYTIGVYSAADPSDTSGRFNAYMHGVSSNYPNANEYSDLGTRATDATGAPTQYYKAASDSEELNAVFQEIAEDMAEPNYPTTVGGTGNPLNDGYITFTDTLGDFMEVKDFNEIYFYDSVNTNAYAAYSEKTVETSGNTTTYTFSGTVVGSELFGSNEVALSNIIIRVTKANDLRTGDTVTVQIPAALIPVRYYDIKDKRDTPEGTLTMTIDEARPIRVFYSVGLKDEADTQLASGSITDEKLQTYVANNTGKDGKTYFYSNSFTAEAEKGNTTATFYPATTNPFYYYLEDTPLYTDDALKTRAQRGDQYDYYYYPHTYYEMTDDGPQQVNSWIRVTYADIFALYEDNALGYDANDNVYLKAGTFKISRMRSFTEGKTNNATGTATTVVSPDWSKGNELATISLGNNGRLSVEVPGSLAISKTVTADTGLTAPEAEFEFTVGLKDSEGNALTGSYKYTLGTETGEIENGDIVKLKAGQQVIIHDLPAGTEYTVTETDQPGFTQAKTDDTGTIASGVQSKAAFTNNYSVAKLTASDLFQVQKDYNAWDEVPQTFRFALVPENGGPLPTVDADHTWTDSQGTEGIFVDVNSGEAVDFGDIEFTAPGTYTYQIYEMTPTSPTPGISYSNADYQVTVRVEDAHNGTMTATAEMTQRNKDDGTPTSVSVEKKIAAFTNTFEATNAQAGPLGDKVLNDSTGSYNGTFYFTVEAVTPDAPVPNNNVGSVTGSGAISFPQITFTSENVGHTYVYKITERNDNVPGMTYDENEYYAHMEVTSVASTVNPTDAVVQVNVTYWDSQDETGNRITNKDGENRLTFTNSYDPTPAVLEGETALGGTKTLTGRDMGEDTYTFTLTPDNGNPVDGAVIESNTATVEKGTDGTPVDFHFGKITFTKPGTYRFTIAEECPDSNPKDGVLYDTGSYMATVVVEDNNGTLGASVSYSQNGTPVNTAAFTNTYSTSNYVSSEKFIRAEKVLQGRDWKANDYFEFKLTAENNAPLPTSTDIRIVPSETEGDRHIDGFDSITYTAPGTYTYTVTEVQGNLPGVSYSTEPVTVTVKIKDNGDGTLGLDGQVTYSSGTDAALFTNTYAPGSVTLEGDTALKGAKTLVGRTWTDDDNFSFKLEAADDVTSRAISESIVVLDNGTATATAENHNFVFECVTFKEAGTYNFKITEVKGNEATMTYDGHVCTVTVVVRDDTTSGSLVVDNVNYSDSSQASFTNVYANNTKTVDETENAKVGQVLTYTIHWVNNAQDENGKPAASIVTITDGVPTGTDFVEVSDGGTYDADNKMVTWTFEAAAATSGSVQFKVRINEDAKTLIENKANIQIGENGPAVDTNTVTTDLSDPASLTISKTVETVDGQNTTVDTNKEFTFKVTLVDSAKKELAGAYPIQGTDKTFTSGGTITLKHGESATIENLPAGTYYTVTETDIPAGYTADAETQTGTIDEDSTAYFTNTYSVAGATTATINARKILTYFSGEEMELKPEQFGFVLVDANDIDNVLASAKNDADGSVSFEMEYTRIGTYNYTIREVNNNLGGIEYDESTYGVTVTVSDKGDGTIGATVAYLTEDKQEPTFRNNYRADIDPDDPAAQVSLEINKNLTGRDMKDGEFSFSVLDKDGNTVSTGTNDSNGVVKFAPFGFGVTDSEFNDMVNPEEPEQPAETPEVQPETPTEDEGNTEDEASETTPVPSEEPTVTPEETPGETESTEDAPEEEPSEEAEATPAPSEQPNEPVETTEPETTGEPEAAAVTEETERTAHARTDWTDQQLKGLIGDHWYSIVENGVDGNGVTYDKTVYYVKVTVNDNGDGALVVSAPAYYTEKDNEKISIDAVAFENTYAAAPAEITLQAGKQLLGRGLQEGEFTFQLSENGAVVAEAVNNANGSILFDMTYDTVGEHTYTVTEKAGDVHQIDYDAASFEVKVSVTDNGMGQLVAAATYPETILFTNTYTPDAVQVTLEAAKKLEGRAMEAGEFLFRVTDAEGNELATGRNDADGKVRFSAITFTQAGSYVLTLREEAGSAEYVTYDDKAYQVTVRVTDEDGRLVAAVEQPENGVTFTNKYKEPAPEPTPTATPAPGSNNDNTPDPTATPAPTPAALIPQTGDEMPIGLLCALLAISAAALVALVVVRKRRGGKE